MVVILKSNPDQQQLNNLKDWLKSFHLDIHESQGVNSTILGLVGDTTVVDIDLLNALDIVEDVKRIQEPYKNANRKFHAEDTVVDVGRPRLLKASSSRTSVIMTAKNTIIRSENWNIWG